MLKGKGYGNTQKTQTAFLLSGDCNQFNWTEELFKGKKMSGRGLMNTKRENRILRNSTLPRPECPRAELFEADLRGCVALGKKEGGRPHL